MKKLTSLVSRILFVGSFVLVGLAVWQKLASIFGYVLLMPYYRPGRLLEFAVIASIFVIALQLREIKMVLQKEGSI